MGKKGGNYPRVLGNPFVGDEYETVGEAVTGALARWESQSGLRLLVPADGYVQGAIVATPIDRSLFQALSEGDSDAYAEVIESVGDAEGPYCVVITEADLPQIRQGVVDGRGPAVPHEPGDEEGTGEQVERPSRPPERPDSVEVQLLRERVRLVEERAAFEREKAAFEAEKAAFQIEAQRLEIERLRTALQAANVPSPAPMEPRAVEREEPVRPEQTQARRGVRERVKSRLGRWFGR